MSGRAVALGDPSPWHGGTVTAHATCVLAPNPSPMTLDGTNTWLVRSGRDVLVVDPGPDDPAHLDAIVAEVDGAHVARILLTHGHPDHSEGAVALAGRLHAAVLALDPAHRLGDEGLVGGDVVVVGDVALSVVPTPGHTDDSLSFHLPVDGALLTGDTVLGRGSTVIAHPEGRLADYLASLRRLRDLAESSEAAVVLPGHGPALVDPAGAVSAYLAHREQRLEQVRAALASGARTADEVVEIVYADVPRDLWPAARLSVLAQLDYLRA
ncbi:MAG TPA: MBL fold metallo-hydrolase [Candidatus Nanopelagicales bacterium]|nr:MBL fold metallo-hydrolase [Candidatus Nanopelagicales bacterium]